ncbi:hypothetical protein [Absidia glauca]|uniref:MIT domain-containing protein n=1 Tax=Absidia glauca TaxID=4829 RepID=A0A168R006_ABSGL|nr:hypothetical protein [Absidia glauca]
MPTKTSRRSTFNRPRFMKNAPVLSSKAPSKKRPLQLTLTPTPETTSPVLSWTEAALDKANMAVLYDNRGFSTQALDAYNEAIILLDKVFESSHQCMDPVRLRKIYASYADRVSMLTLQCAGSCHNPTTQTPPTPSPVTTLHTDEKDSQHHRSSDLTNGDSSPSPDVSVSSPSSIPANERLSVPSTRGSQFGSIIVKRQPSKDHLEPPDQTIVSPTLSRSKSALSLTKTFLFGRKQGWKNESQCLGDDKGDSLILPNMDLRPNDDYFGLKSTLEENHLHYSDRESVLNSMGHRHFNNNTSGHKGHGLYDYDLNAAHDIDTATPAKASLTLSLSPSSSSASTKHQPQLPSPAPSILTSSSSSSRSIFSSGPSDSDDSSMLSISLLPSLPLPWPEPKSGDNDICDNIIGDPSAPSMAEIWGDIDPDSLSAITQDTVPTSKTQHLPLLERQPSCTLLRSTSSKSIASHSGLSKPGGLSTLEPFNTSPNPFTFWPSKIPGTLTIKGVDITVAMATSTSSLDGKSSNLLTRLRQSMEKGGYITDRIHAPKQLWSQTCVRLPAIESKLSCCEQILKLFQRMHDITRLFDHHPLDQDDITTEAFYLLDKLDRTLDHIKHTCKSTTEGIHQNHPDAAVKQRQRSTIHSFKEPLNAWSAKLSKSVDRIKIEIKSGQVLKSSGGIPDQWGMQFRARTSPIHAELLRRTGLCHESLSRVIGGFVMRDFELLLDRWIKKSREWLLEE